MLEFSAGLLAGLFLTYIFIGRKANKQYEEALEITKTELRQLNRILLELKRMNRRREG